MLKVNTTCKSAGTYLLRATCLPIALVCISINAFCQKKIDTAYVFKHIRAAYRKIHQGQYTSNEKYTLLQAGVDTSSQTSRYKCYFIKNLSDTLVGYKMASFNADTTNTTIVYDGKMLAMHMPWIKTLEMVDARQYPGYAKSLLRNQIFDNLNTWLFRSKWKQKISVSGSVYHNKHCYRIAAGNFVNFIDASSFLPVANIVTVNSSVNGLLQLQILEEWTEDVALNNKIDDNLFTPNIFKGYTREVMYTGQKEKISPHILKISATAPDWKLPLLNGDSLALHDLTGKIVILDFWFKACVPCQLQMASLQKIQDKIDTGKVVIIGVNIYDDPLKEKLVAMLTKAGISMKTVYHGESIQKAYGVSGAPSLFVINKKGEIAYVKDGYSENLMADVIKIISEESSN